MLPINIGLQANIRYNTNQSNHLSVSFSHLITIKLLSCYCTTLHISTFLQILLFFSCLIRNTQIIIKYIFIWKVLTDFPIFCFTKCLKVKSKVNDCCFKKMSGLARCYIYLLHSVLRLLFLKLVTAFFCWAYSWMQVYCLLQLSKLSILFSVTDLKI